MRSALILGTVIALGVAGAAGAEAAEKPFVLAQTGVGAAGTSGACAIVKAAKPADLAQYFKDNDATDVAIDGKNVTGKYKQIDVGATAFESGEIVFLADFGKQSTVDQTFINAYNKNSYAIIYRPEDSNVYLKLPIDISSGVTTDYLKSYTSRFFSSIDRALTYKVE